MHFIALNIILEGAFISKIRKSTFSQVDLLLERVPRGLLNNNSQIANHLINCVYGSHQRENTGSRLFTEVKPCWTGLISGWVTI